MELLLENVNIVNPFCEIKTNQSVLIRDNIIEEISSKINPASNTEIIDCEDNYLLSAFIVPSII